MTDTNDPLDPGRAETTTRRSAYRLRLRTYFLTGLVITVPLFLTLYITWTIVVWIDSWVTPLLPLAYTPDAYLPFHVPGFGLVVALVVITILGFLTANLAGRTLVARGEALLSRMPIVRNLYRGLKQIVERVVSTGSRPFQTVGLIEYPREGLWTLVFVMNTAKGEIPQKSKSGEELVSVFVPTTPTALTGYVVFVPKSRCVILDMSAEDAAKIVISAGLVMPDNETGSSAGEPVKIDEAIRRVRAIEQPNRRESA